MSCGNKSHDMSLLTPCPANNGKTQSDNYVSMREIIKKILRHLKTIIVTVFLSTLSAGIFFIISPKQFEAEGYLQVIPPPSAKDGRIDRDLFENMIVSQLQKVSSAHIAEIVSESLKKEKIDLTPLKIMEKIKITRPPKTDLLRIKAQEETSHKALSIVNEWIREYFNVIERNNTAVSIAQVRTIMNQVQSELMEKQATTDKLRMQVAQIEPLVTLFRAVDDRQLWSDLTRKGGPDPEAIKKLSEIHIKSQEQSKEYIDLKVILTKAEQELSAAQSKRDFYKLAERILENKITKTTFDRKHDEIAVDNKLLLEAQFYVDIMIKNVQVIKFGEPALIYSSQGILVKTSLFFLSSFLLCCFCAFIYEWWVEPLKKE